MELSSQRRIYGRRITSCKIPPEPRRPGELELTTGCGGGTGLQGGRPRHLSTVEPRRRSPQSAAAAAGLRRRLYASPLHFDPDRLETSLDAVTGVRTTRRAR